MPKLKSTSGKKKPTPLSTSFEKRLLAYAAVASAAGIGFMAAAKPAEAEIVYTPVAARVSPTFALDLDHDGFVDYNLIPFAAASIAGSLRFSYLNVCHDALAAFSHQCVSSTFDANADNLVAIDENNFAAALQRGTKIGPAQIFGGTGVRVGMAGRTFYSGSNTAEHWTGPWVNNGKGVTDRYLGLKFKINGEYHFGWARISVRAIAHRGFYAFLTGYAYETTPNKGLIAGQTSESAHASNMNLDEPAPKMQKVTSLGMLALGSDGISLWRKEEQPKN
jgi:hypothetical protein